MSFKKIIPNLNNIEIERNNLRETINNFKNDINGIINKLTSLIENIESYYKIYNDIINNYEIKNRNYIILQNINNIINYSKNFEDNLKEIIQIKNINNKFPELMKIYNKICLKENIFNKNSNSLFNTSFNNKNSNIHLLNNNNNKDYIKTEKEKKIEEKQKNKEKVLIKDFTVEFPTFQKINKNDKSIEKRKLIIGCPAIGCSNSRKQIQWKHN